MKFYRQEKCLPDCQGGESTGFVYGLTKKEIKRKMDDSGDTPKDEITEFNVSMNKWDWIGWLDAWAAHPDNG